MRYELLVGSCAEERRKKMAGGGMCCFFLTGMLWRVEADFGFRLSFFPKKYDR